ncbi:MAG: alanine racemase [Patescibacteria group bacterium]
MDRAGLRTWIEVDTRLLRKNYRIFRTLIPKKTRLMAVVKSNAYGHSLIDFSRSLDRFGAQWFGVDSIVEARSLRREGIRKPILVLGSTLPEWYVEAAQNNISVTISNFESLERALKQGTVRKPLKAHIKIDTGMHRQGFMPNEIERVLGYFKEKQNFLILEGMYTHFAAAKNPAFPRDTQKQIDEFTRVASLVAEAGFKPLRHAAATSGTILFSSAHFDMVRIGIGMFGLWPSREVRAFAERRLGLVPALTWKTVISELKDLPAGSAVGYDLSETLHKPSRVAILPVGYWHGYPRVLSSIGYVIIRGKRAKVIGRVSMDMLVVDVSRIKKVRIRDEAVLLGPGMSADELADLTGTSNYEIVTRLNPLIKRIYT